MTTLRSAAVLACLLALLGHGCAQQDEPPKVTLNLADASVAKAAAAIGEAAGVTVLVMSHVTGQVTVGLKDVTVEDALGALAEACEGSWLRTYVIEPVDAKPAQPTAEEVAQQLQTAWGGWLQRRTAEEMGLFRERAFAANGGEPPTVPEPTAGGGARVDMVEMLRGPFGSERISLQLQGVTVQEALDRFTLESGGITLLAPDVEGQVTVELEDATLSDVLDALCPQVSATWRPLYLVGQPKEVSETDVEQFINQMMRNGAERFWQLPPEQRQDIVRQAAERMQNLPPEVVSAVRSSPWTPRILGMAIQFVMTMTPDQRREIMPIMQGLGRLVGQ